MADGNRAAGAILVPHQSRSQLVAPYPWIYTRRGRRVAARWRILPDAEVRVCTRARTSRALTSTHRGYPFFAARMEAVFLNGNVRPVNLSLALLLGPFRSSQNGGPTISASRVRWLLVPVVGGGDGASLWWLEALDLSVGLLWGMLACPRDAVLRSPISFRLQPRYSSLFSPSLSCSSQLRV